MKTLEEQAQELANSREKLDKVYSMGLYYGFLEGANSKWVKAEKIKAQIDILKLAHIRLSIEGIDKFDDTMIFTVNELEQQLKKLEDEQR